MADQNKPTEKNPVKVMGYKERWKADDGTTFERNLDTRGKRFTWLNVVQKGRFKAKVLRKEIIRAVSPETNQGGFFTEQVSEHLLIQLEMGYRKNGEWENIRMQFRPQDEHYIQSCIDGLHKLRDIFAEDNPRSDVQ